MLEEIRNGKIVKICKDGRVWGQNNKEAGGHLGIFKNSSRDYIKKGHNPNSIGRPFQKGYKDSDEIKIKKSLGHKGLLAGEKHWNWKGGITSLGINIRNLVEYAQWRSDVFQRDNWTCQTCGAKSTKGKAVYSEAHHIKEFADIIRENNITSVIEAQLCKGLWDIDNGITLCKDCHKLTKRKEAINVL